MISLYPINSGGSSSVNNIASISDFKISDGVKHNVLTSAPYNAKITANQLMISDEAAPTMVTGLQVKQIADTTFDVSAKITTSSGRVIPIVGPSFLLKALGVAMAIRKNRVGINVEPTTYLDGVAVPAFDVVASQLNTSGPLAQFSGSITNPNGVGFLFSRRICSSRSNTK